MSIFPEWVEVFSDNKRTCSSLEVCVESFSMMIRYSWKHRFFQRLLVQKVKGFTSAGHVMVITIYVIINAVLLFTNIDWSLPSNIARRCGW